MEENKDWREELQDIINREMFKEDLMIQIKSLVEQELDRAREEGYKNGVKDKEREMVDNGYEQNVLSKMNGKQPDIKLVRALQKDFKELYVKEYTTGWREARFIRNIELGIMSLKNTEKYIEELSKLTTK